MAFRIEYFAGGDRWFPVDPDALCWVLDNGQSIKEAWRKPEGWIFKSKMGAGRRISELSGCGPGDERFRVVPC